ncbi:CAP domain-containing protein [Poronia punctata]|nr:CAP domain-containing protein [Poronia punctata]
MAGHTSLLCLISTLLFFTLTLTTTAAPSPPSDLPTLRATVLNSTNFYRTIHSANPVSWNTTLAAYADAYLANVTSSSPTSSKCKFAHSGGPYGENLALGCADITACIDMWGVEGEGYDFARPDFDHDTGHFTQLVWKDTTDVGCGWRVCGGGKGLYLVCEYWPRGNVLGEFGEEVVEGDDDDEEEEEGDDGEGNSGGGGGRIVKRDVRPLPAWMGVLAFVAGIGILVLILM